MSVYHGLATMIAKTDSLIWPRDVGHSHSCNYFKGVCQMKQIPITSWVTCLYLHLPTSFELVLLPVSLKLLKPSERYNRLHHSLSSFHLRQPAQSRRWKSIMYAQRGTTFVTKALAGVRGKTRICRYFWALGLLM